MHLEAVIERVWRCTRRPWSSEFGDALRCRDRESLDMHLEAAIKRVWRCTWRPRSSEFGIRDQATLEMHMEVAIDQVWRCTWRPWSREFGDALWGHDRARLEEYLGDSQSGGCKFGREVPRERRFYSLVNSSLCECRELSKTWSAERWDWLGAGDSGSWDDAVRSVCSTQWMLY